MSWYNQHVKWPFDRAKSRMDPQAFLATLEDFHWLDYERLLGRWSAVLGEERVGVAVLEKGQVEDATADFLARAGIDPAGLELDAERANDSLPVHMLEIARHLGLHELKGGKRMRVLNALQEPASPTGRRRRGSSTVYSPEERNRVLARFDASNRAVARRFLGREALFLEPPPGPDAPYWRFPELSRDALLDDWVAPVIRRARSAEASAGRTARRRRAEEDRRRPASGSLQLVPVLEALLEAAGVLLAEGGAALGGARGRADEGEERVERGRVVDLRVVDDEAPGSAAIVRASTMKRL